MTTHFQVGDDATLAKMSRLLRDQNQLITASVDMVERTAALVERSRSAIRRAPKRPIVPRSPSVILSS
jgi:hypothetical protein